MFLRIKKQGKHRYLQLVENVRDERGKVKQKLFHSFGNYDKLIESGGLDKLDAEFSRLAGRFHPSNIDENNISIRTYSLGPALIFQRLWDELGLPEIFQRIVSRRKIQFSVERAVFLEVLHRLFSGGSDRSAMSWREDYEIPGTCDIQLQHMYRAMKFLGENKNKIEEHLFTQNRDLFNHTVDLVFFDTTSLYFESEKESDLKKRGHSKDHRNDALQVVFGVLLDKDGRPIASEILPGNTADVTTVQPLINRLRKRFKIRRVVFVGDRGFTSNENLQAFEQTGLEYIAGVKMRNLKETKEIVLPQATDFNAVTDNLQVQEIVVEDRRYIVCYNPEQAARDEHVRTELVQSLEHVLQQGSKRLVSNKGYRKYARIENDAITIDEEKISREEIYDGIWVLRTNTDLPASEVALQYKRLWQVEQFFRNTKCMLDTRPIFHQNDKSIIGHIFISFLALLLRYELYQRLKKKNHEFEWQEIVDSLKRLRRTVISETERETWWRSDADRLCVDIFRAVGVAIPRIYQEHR
jgi:transposase